MEEHDSQELQIDLLSVFGMCGMVVGDGLEDYLKRQREKFANDPNVHIVMPDEVFERELELLNGYIRQWWAWYKQHWREIGPESRRT